MKLFGRLGKDRIRRHFNQNGIDYILDSDIQISFPLNSNSSDILTRLLRHGELLSTLDDLWTEELLEVVDSNKWRVSYKIYDYIDQSGEENLFNILGLPKSESFQMEAVSSSHVADPSFRINIEATHPDQGPLRETNVIRSDRVFIISEDKIIPLTRPQADLFNIAAANDIDWNDQEDRMAYLAATKKAADDAGAKIDSYLKNEDYEFRTEADLDVVEHGPNEIQLIPKIEGLEDYGTSGEALLDEQTKGVVSRPVSKTKRKRMVLGKELKNRLAQLPKHGRIKGADVPRLLTQPESVIPEGFDLSLFSERVKGIKTKVYNSRPYLHVQKSKKGWFEGVPGIEMEDWTPGSGSDVGNGKDSQPFQSNNLSKETYDELVRRAKSNGEDFVFHNDSWIRIDPEAAERFEQATGQLEKDGDVIKIPAGSILDIYENLELLEFIDKKTLIKSNGQLPDDLPDVKLPESFNGTLYPYQFDGFRWLHRISHHRIGGLLADEMGLGKTVQIISHILKLKESGIEGPHLVVVPKTLIDNWIREIHQFSDGKLKVYPYNISQRYFDKIFFSQFDVIVTTYDTLRRQQSRLATIDWQLVVCDEAQYAKNPTTQRTCALKALKSKHRAALTGTPVENGLIEFWCIMDFVQPGLLGSWADFRKKYERPIIEGKGSERDNQIDQLMTQVKGYYLRRLKDQTIDLPPKRIEKIESTLSPFQYEHYIEIARTAKASGRGAMLGALQKLLMLCAHPAAILGQAAQEKRCPKLDNTIEVLKQIQQKSEKAILFTDYKKIQNVLKERIIRDFNIFPNIINGEISSHRQQVIDIFSEKPGFNVIILGHQVAGVGLNITAANHVIHYTRPWNPAKENQATDRVHRIGQKKAITVYYPIVKDNQFTTVEERLAQLLKSKENLARDVLRPTKDMQVKQEELMDCFDGIN